MRCQDDVCQVSDPQMAMSPRLRPFPYPASQVGVPELLSGRQDFFFSCPLYSFHIIRYFFLTYTLSGRTGSALAWHSEGRTFAAH